uniref:SHSP domain-containing protein n=1 Tax=Spongospora subterranea TaxID=70186 RepID=A0A0H5RTW7_9EUKA|eukprot:CRZ12179.1 hypothetical protein [Spongospora subterranea]
MSLRSLSRILKQFDNTLNRVGRDVRYPTSSLLPTTRMIAPILGPSSSLDSPSDIWSDLDAGLLPDWGGVTPRTVMPMDVVEKDNEFVAEIDVPAGTPKENVSVEKSKQDKTITISADRSTENETKTENYWIKERSFGTTRRIIHVPDNVDMDGIKVKLENGTLLMTMPKTTLELPAKEKLEIEQS